MPKRAAASIEIDAPLDIVWSAMADLRRYHEWNPFIFAVEGVGETPRVGNRMRLHVRWANGKTVRSWETLTRLDAPHTAEAGTARMAYAFDSWLARSGIVVASREQAISEVADGRTLYRTEEFFHGLLGRFVPLADIEDGFRRHATALKQRAEAMAAGKPAPEN